MSSGLPSIPAAAEPVIAAARGATLVNRDAVLSILRAAIVSRTEQYVLGDTYNCAAVALLSSVVVFAMTTMPPEITMYGVYDLIGATRIACSATSAALHEIVELMDDHDEVTP